MHRIILATILTFSTLLRFWDLEFTPRGLYIDEISIGWNTHLVSTTGYDEHNQLLPLAFKAYGEYKLPGYIYSTIPIFWLFGSGIWQLRFISALAGVLGSLGVYLLVKELSKNIIPTEAGIQGRLSANIKLDSRLRGNDTHMALLASALFAITPWSIHLSRGAFEANLALTASIFSLYFLLKLRSVKPTIWQFNHATTFALCLFTFALAFYTYNAARVLLVPLFVLTLIIWRQYFSRITILPLASCLLLLSAPGIIGFSTGGENARALQVLNLGHQELELGPFVGTIYKYFDHYSPKFLFFVGDNLGRHGVRELGVLPMPLIIYLPIGLYFIIRTLPQLQSSQFLFLGMLIAPLPSIIATPSPHALRASYLLPFLIIISAIGIMSFYNYISKHYSLLIIHYSFWTLLSIVFIYNLVTFQHVYYTHWSPVVWPEWSEQYTKGAQYIAQNYPTASRVVMEDNQYTKYYLDFFDAVAGNQIQREFTGIDHIYKIYEELETGDVIGIAGWKQTPPQLTDVYEVVAANQNKDIIYKVGVWQQ